MQHRERDRERDRQTADRQTDRQSAPTLRNLMPCSVQKAVMSVW